MRSTILYDKVSPRIKALIDLIACLIGLIVFCLIIQSSWGSFIKAVAINDAEIAGSVRITTVPGRFSIVFGSTLMVIEFIFLAIKSLIRLKNPTAFEDENATNSELSEGGDAI